MNASKIATFAVGPIGGALLGVVLLPVTAWLFPIEDVGRIAMLQVVLGFSVLLFSLGLDQAYVREYHEEENKHVLLKTTALPGLCLLIIALIACLVRPELLSVALFSVASIKLTYMVAICVLAAFVSRFLSLILRMQEKGLIFSLSQILPKATILFVIGGYYLFQASFDLTNLVLAYLFSGVAVAAYLGWVTRDDWLPALALKVDKDRLRELLRFGGPLILGGVAFWGLTAMDRVFLRTYSTFEELGVYSVSVGFASIGNILQSVFSVVWAPIVYKWVAAGADLKKVDAVTQIVLLAVVVLFSLAGMLSWIASLILPSGYEKVQYLVVACLGYPLFYTLSETTVVGIGVARKTVYSLAASALALAVNLAGNFALVPKYGAAGAAVSTAIAFWIFLVARTEFSCLVWRSLPRLKLYLLTFVSLAMSVAFAFSVEAYFQIWFAGWSALLVTTVFLFRDVLVGWAKSPVWRQG